MGTGDILLNAIHGGVAILLGILYAKETGVSSGRSGIQLVCAF